MAIVSTTRTLLIRDHGWNRIRKDLSQLNRAHTKVGLPSEGALAVVEVPEGKEVQKSMADLVQIAAIHEFGAPKAHIPQRSFIRSTFDKNVAVLRLIVRKEYDRVLGGADPKAALARIGEWMTVQTKLTIKNRIPPPLKPATLKAKTVGGKVGDVPLIDTAQLIQSIQHVEVLR